LKSFRSEGGGEERGGRDLRVTYSYYFVQPRFNRTGTPRLSPNLSQLTLGNEAFETLLIELRRQLSNFSIEITFSLDFYPT